MFNSTLSSGTADPSLRFAAFLRHNAHDAIEQCWKRLNRSSKVSITLDTLML
jgi:hypothetical protein